MSAIATFTKFPKTALEGLRKAAVPKKRFFGGVRDDYWEYMREHGEVVADYAWSGYVLATLLPYLEEHHDIELMKSEFDELGDFLSEARKATYFVFTRAHKQQVLSKLDGQFSTESLGNYFREFNETDEPEAGNMMLDGIRAFQRSLAAVDESSVIVVGIT